MSMTPARVESLFADAIARPPPEREAFLARECGGEAALLQQLLALLAAHNGSHSLLRDSVPGQGFRGQVAASRELLHEEKPGRSTYAARHRADRGRNG